MTESEVWAFCDEEIKVVICTVVFGVFGRNINKDFDGIDYEEDEIPNVIDYLRSKGYALPWMGLSVEELVSFGWVKLND